MKWVLRLVIFTLCFFAAARFCKKQTGSFTIARITSDLPYHPEWDAAPSNEEEIKRILSQPYRFLGKGAQSFVFASEDGTTVIKFFRHHHLKKNSKLAKDFGSYKLAYDLLRNETGLLYLHLNKTNHLHQTLDLVDKIGIHHPIDLDKYEFLVQKRAKLSYVALEEWIQEGKIEQAKQALTSLVQLLAKRTSMGIYDKDPDLNTNFGFIGLESIQFDIGRFKLREKPQDPTELYRITDNLHQFLEQRAPELDQHLKEELKKHEV
ncbi:MAG: hypothetical protein ABSA17_03170 [Rhabdochlamydiaceae bacterium]|jgi:hypothetical protein